jgi:hypothetical protein
MWLFFGTYNRFISGMNKCNIEAVGRLSFGLRSQVPRYFLYGPRGQFDVLKTTTRFEIFCSMKSI